ncbi:hypothetical protein F5Y14DRAFT_444397 [Nemania sp. NC0429]|nr:hypothetical protein F5Y14DRAFT_444397 [Nemania sp. NC0429]
MGFRKESMDVASRSLGVDKDPEIASTTTITGGSTNGRWQLGDFESKLPFLNQGSETRRRYAKYGLIAILWLSSLVLTSWFTAVMRPWPPRYSYETGFDTELEPLRPQIELVKVKFKGGLKFDENGTTYRAIDPDAPQYVGEPSPELDRRWKSLIRGQAVDLINEEAESVADITYQKPGGWYLSGPDSFHQLHCLDVLRRALRPDYYTPPNVEPVHTMHVEHCIDYIRQGIMCAADLTMIPAVWSTKRDRLLQDTEVVHTCRNFDKIHAWTLARDANAHPKQKWD